MNLHYPTKYLNGPLNITFFLVLFVLAGRAWANEEPPPPCQPCHCDAPCPGGTITFTNVVIWPGTNICGLGCWVAAWPEYDWRCQDVTRHGWCENATTNCPDWYDTNTYCPGIITNWWVLNAPGFSASGGGDYVPPFLATNCGSGSVTFYCEYGNWHPCTGQLCASQTIPISKAFTVNCGVQQIVGQGNELVDFMPAWPSLSFSLGVHGDSPFTVSFPSTVTGNKTWIEELYCCTNQCGSGIVRHETTTVNATNPHVSLDAVDFNLLSFFPEWYSSAVQALTPLDTNNWVALIQSWAHLTLNFSASGSANLVIRHYSDGCLGCDTGTLVDGTATAHVAGSDDLDIEALNIHVHLGGWVNGEWNGWIESIGNGSSAYYKAQTHYTWFLYASYIIGPDQGQKQTQGGNYDPDPASSTQICWSPNF